MKDLQEKILKTLEINQDIFSDVKNSNKLSSYDVADYVSEHYRPRITVEQLREVYGKIFEGELSFSKATQILNGDEDTQSN